MELNGKVALVLGAIKGIGKGIGLALADRGVKVALNYFDWEEELEGMIFNEGYAAANRGISLLTETWARMATRRAEKTRGWGLLSESCKKALIDHTLLQRTGTVDDVVKTVLYMIKDASFMTGSVLRLDGGYVLGGENVGAMPEGVV